jgi:hypothetical protein
MIQKQGSGRGWYLAAMWKLVNELGSGPTNIAVGINKGVWESFDDDREQVEIWIVQQAHSVRLILTVRVARSPTAQFVSQFSAIGLQGRGLLPL